MDNQLFDKIKRQYTSFNTDEEKIAFLLALTNFQAYLSVIESEEINLWAINRINSLTDASDFKLKTK